MDIWLLSLAAAVGGIAGSICALFAQNIRAKRIEIVDRDGKGRIQLSVERPGTILPAGDGRHSHHAVSAQVEGCVFSK